MEPIVEGRRSAMRLLTKFTYFGRRHVLVFEILLLCFIGIFMIHEPRNGKISSRFSSREKMETGVIEDRSPPGRCARIRF